MVPGVELSVSVTTRERRPTERDGVDYRFVDDREFSRLVQAGELLEWAEVFGHRYGTPAGRIRRALEEGRDVVLEIDVQGARQVRDAMPDAVLVFLAPPSLEELERRLRLRGTEDEHRLARRLATASAELQAGHWFDHVVVNDELEHASSQVAAIIEITRAASSGHPERGETGDRSPGPGDLPTSEGNAHP
jgi:guanylate kinase